VNWNNGNGNDGKGQTVDWSERAPEAGGLRRMGWFSVLDEGGPGSIAGPMPRAMRVEYPGAI